MIRQKRPTQQYKLLQKEYDDVYKDIMLNGYDFSGPYTEKCQEKLKEITGRKHMYMTISGTGAITAAIYALDLFDKKVAVGSWNYSACVNQYQAFSKPVFVDCDDNFFIDIESISGLLGKEVTPRLFFSISKLTSPLAVEITGLPTA